MISTSSNKQDSGLETDHAIVGAGVAGIALARRFAQSQQDFMVVEKARSPGGRLATRRDQNTKFDHGAQFYKLDGSAMSLVEHGFNGADLKPWFQREQIQFMCCAQGMNALIKKPAEQFREKIILNMKVQTIIFESSRERPYQLIFEDGSQILARNVYLTCPLPQSLKILSDSNINYQNDLDQIDYAEALVGMLILKKESFNEAEVSKILEFKYQDRVSEDVFSIANQASKGLSDELAFTVVMAPDFSHHNFDLEETLSLIKITSRFASSITQLLGVDIKTDHVERSQLKKWRFSYPVKHYHEPHVIVQPGLILLGDAFGGGSINGSMRSACSVDLY